MNGFGMYLVCALTRTVWVVCAASYDKETAGKVLEQTLVVHMTGWKGPFIACRSPLEARKVAEMCWRDNEETRTFIFKNVPA